MSRPRQPKYLESKANHCKDRTNTVSKADCREISYHIDGMKSCVDSDYEIDWEAGGDLDGCPVEIGTNKNHFKVQRFNRIYTLKKSGVKHLRDSNKRVKEFKRRKK
jgi:hypothetical protein